MKKTILSATLAVVALTSVATDKMFIYSPAIDKGVHVAYAANGEANAFCNIGQIFQSDYARWGSDKKMYSEFAIALDEGGYAAVFQVNDVAPCFAVAYSRDLITWRPQDYPRMSHQGVLAPVIVAKGAGKYDVVYRTKDDKFRKTTTDANFRHFTPDVPATADEYAIADKKRARAKVGDKEFTGNILTINDNGETLSALKAYFAKQGENYAKSLETFADDSKRYASLISAGKASAKLNINVFGEKKISDKLIGIFFEDISYAADGGLYAEMVQNRDFEYTPADHSGWNAFTAWQLASGKQPKIVTSSPLSQQNPHALSIAADTLYNDGWDGMSLKAGEKYDFSMYVKPSSEKSFVVALVDGSRVLASERIETAGKEWAQYSATLTPSASATTARLMLVAEGKKSALVDMISLFPQKTFKGRKNGLRDDLAQTIANLQPKFVRFPGGCMSHGDGLDNIYRWKHTVGPLEERTPDRNIWHYHQTRGLGFYEYFQFCEDIGAEPLPVLAAGVPCQNSAPDANGYGGQQGGIPMDEMPAYIQEILDMIEWANGDPATSKWAKMRAEAGHPAPFNLKYIGIGNEDIISTAFEDRFVMICRAIREKYPEIQICGTAGPFHNPSSDYIEGWLFAFEHQDIIDLVDEHYYESVGWFVNNQDYYDNYDRKGPKVYLGEYAARSAHGNIDCALAEALHLCGIERNGDVVEMTSYAPMLCHKKHQNWNPDMIYFDNETIELTPSYHTQRLFSKYSGTHYLESYIEGLPEDAQRRVAASIVCDTKTGKGYLKVVNTLPVALTLDVTGLEISSDRPFEGFSGKPGQERVEVKSGKTGKLDKDVFKVELPPYSFRVIEL